MTRILIVDDEPQIRRFLRISLSSQDYEIVEAITGRQALQTAALMSPDLVMLDLGLPDMDGQQLLSELREFYKGPIIVLSVRQKEAEKVKALDNGANDYVVKPFGIQELLARIRGLLKIFNETELPAALFDDGAVRIDLSLRRVIVDRQESHLSKKEFQLLKTLMMHGGRLITQQQLLRELWGPAHLHNSHYLRIFIARLRSKLKDDPGNPRYIETEPGVGYRFVGENKLS